MEHSTKKLSFNEFKHLPEPNRRPSGLSFLLPTFSDNSPKFLSGEKSPRSIKDGYPGIYLDDVNKKILYTYLDIFVLIVSLLFYLSTICSYIYLSFSFYNLYKSQDDLKLWFILTLSFVIFSSLITSLFSLVWFSKDRINGSTNGSDHFQWSMIMFIHFIQLGLLFRFIRCIKHSVKFILHQYTDPSLIRKKLCLHHNIYKEAESATLSLMESFLNSAPQVILQLYIMTSINPHENKKMQPLPIAMYKLQGITVILSIINISWSLMVFQRAMRITSKFQKTINKKSMALLFLWNSFTLTSRVISLSQFAHFSKDYFLIFCIAHCILMFICNLFQKSHLVNNLIGNFFLNCSSAYIQLFCHFNIKEGYKKLFIVFYVTFVFMENIALIVIWFIFSSQSQWYAVAAVQITVGSYCIGLVYIFIHYLFYHPNHLLQRCCKSEVETEINRKLSCASAIHVKSKLMPDDDSMMDNFVTTI